MASFRKGNFVADLGAMVLTGLGKCMYLCHCVNLCSMQFRVIAPAGAKCPPLNFE